jgi:serine/threonine-protein kinase
VNARAGPGGDAELAGALADGRRLIRRAQLLALAAAVAAGVLVAGVGSGTREVVQSYRAPDTSVPTGGGSRPTGPLATVPDVVGEDEEAAIDVVQGAGYEAEVEAVEVEDVEPGVVAEQDPAAGTEAPTGSLVTLLVAGQPDGATVPDVVGLSEAEARATLEEAGLEVVGVSEEETADVPAGIVVRSEPAGGTAVEPGSGVALVVSSGPSDTGVD